MLLLLLACAPQNDSAADDSARDTDTAGDTDTADSAPYSPAADACAAARPGPPSGADPALDWSAAHALVRYFLASADWTAADEALLGAMGEAELGAATPDGYAAIGGVCVRDADPAALGPAVLTVEGDMARLAPGTDLPTLPGGLTRLVLDVRDLPATPEADAALDAVLDLALAGPIELGTARVRAWDGFPMQWSTSAYSTSREDLPLERTGAAPADLPLVVLTGPASSPHAARVAAALRLAGRATLVGYDVWTQVAESTWAPIGSAGLLVRTSLLRDAAGEEWPDVVPADVATADPAAAFGALPALGAVGGDNNRGTVKNWDGAAGTGETAHLDRAARRAALLVAHGALERFWPYFDTTGIDLDAPLRAAIAEADALADDDRVGFEHTLGHFMNALHDGHAFYGDWYGGPVADGYVAAQIQAIAGAPVVRTSLDPALLPGDTIVAVDGTGAADWYAEATARRSAATDGYRFDLACREMLTVYGSRTFTVRHPDGTEASITPTPVDEDTFYADVVWGGTLRPSGFLADLGAPGVYLLNLNGLVTTTDDQLDAAAEALATATGVVVDMRDYPAVNHYSVAGLLRDEAYASAYFGYRGWVGPDEATSHDEHYEFGAGDTYAGPIVLLVSNKTVSAAENFSEMLYLDDDVTVIGQASAGTNGNITGLYLPGGYYAMFTGMHIRNPDGTELMGVGIPLDEAVSPTADDFAAGRDPELERAVGILLGG